MSIEEMLHTAMQTVMTDPSLMGESVTFIPFDGSPQVDVDAVVERSPIDESFNMGDVEERRWEISVDASVLPAIGRKDVFMIRGDRFVVCTPPKTDAGQHVVKIASSRRRTVETREGRRGS